MELLSSVECVLVVSFFLLTVQQVPGHFTLYTSALGGPLPAVQTHMPTKQGNVPHIQPQEPPVTQPKTKLDPDQLQREGRELLDLSQSIQEDIGAINHGLHPKDTLEKLKRIQKLAKHLRGEIAP